MFGLNDYKDVISHQANTDNTVVVLVPKVFALVLLTLVIVKSDVIWQLLRHNFWLDSQEKVQKYVCSPNIASDLLSVFLGGWLESIDSVLTCGYSSK